MLEKENSLGGNFRLNIIPSFKDDYYRYVIYLINKLKESRVNVKLNHLFTKDNLVDYNAEVIINATGAVFKKLNIPGLNQKDVLSPYELYENRDFSMYNIVIVGGGLIGVEAAINIVLKGGQATIIEKDNELAKKSYRANKQHLIYLLKKNKIKTFLNTDIINSKENQLNCKDENGNDFKVDYNSISICVGMTPLNSVFENSNNVITIGDVDTVENVLNAVWTAYRK